MLLCNVFLHSGAMQLLKKKQGFGRQRVNKRGGLDAYYCDRRQECEKHNGDNQLRGVGILRWIGRFERTGPHITTAGAAGTSKGRGKVAVSCSDHF